MSGQYVRYPLPVRAGLSPAWLVVTRSCVLQVLCLWGNQERKTNYMSKNMTRKGLAIGTASALVITGLIGTPAFAGGLADKTFVSLTPTTGTAYTVLTGASKTFSLTANEATSVAGTGRNVKFLVTDADSKIEPTAGSVGRTAFTVDQTSGSQYTAVAATDVVTIIRDGSSLAVGDRIVFAQAIDANGATAGVVQAANTVVQVTAVDGTTSFSFKASADIAANVSSATTLDGTDSAVKVVREARETDGSYVVNSGSATDTANEVLILSTGAAEDSTRTVTVEAWVDANSNDLIDGTEYASPVRTVVFKKASEITGTITFAAPALGDSNLTASFKTNPELNGPQVGNTSLNVGFTRQGNAGTGHAAATWDATNGEWDATLATNSNSTSGGTQVQGNTGADWSALSTAIAGTYSARPFIGTTAIATAVSGTTGSTQADDVKAEIVASANNDGGKNEDASANTNAGTTVTARSGSTVTVTATIYDNDSPAAVVGAGIPVTATLSGVTGTIKVNGASSSDQEVTDANGKVTFTVTTTTAAASQASDSAIITIQAQNVNTATKQGRFTINWDDATVTVYDLSVANAKNDLNRSVAKNGTVNFNFRIADQWAQALSGTYRLLVENTGNTVSTSYAAVTNGSASVSVTDGQIAAGSSISTGITVQKDVSGTWTNQTPTNTNSSNKITYTIGVLDQTDEVKLDTNGSSTFGSGTADDADTISTKAVAAIDTRVSNAAVAVAGETAVTVTGVVRHATSSVVRPGARVTVTGTSDMLFATGGVYALGSITFVADSNGEFSVDVYSNKAQEDTVVTVTSGAGSATKKVTFTVANNAGAKSWVITAPASAKPGSTFMVKGKLVDAFGNGLDTASTDNSSAAKFSVTYTGPGIVFGSLPTETNASGEFSFAVLLGTNDSGTATITASYDYDGASTTYTAAATSASVAVGTVAKVNVGSFNGKLVVYANGYNGKRISWKVGGRWGSAVASSDTARFDRPTPRTGVTVSVDIYVDGVKQLTKSVVTR